MREKEDVSNVDGQCDFIPRSSMQQGTSNQQSFDFMLTGPMWKEFCLAANAYGRSIQIIGTYGILVFSAGLFIGVEVGEFFDHIGISVFMIAAILLFLAYVYSRRFVCRGVLTLLLYEAGDWFAGLPRVASWDGRRMLKDFLADRFDDRWRTPCSLLVSDRGGRPREKSWQACAAGAGALG